MLHKFVKNEAPIPPSFVQKDGRVVTDPKEILAAHSLTWSQQWKAGEEGWVLEALKSISDAIAQASAASTQPKKKFTPALIRAAARRFCSRTSTGTDYWALKEFFLMPDPVSETLGELMADIQFDATPRSKCSAT